MTLFFAKGVIAQFKSSQETFCYRYVRTNNDGIISKNSNADEIVFVTFQKKLMGKESSSAKTAGQKLVEDPNYYDNLAKSRIAEWNNPNDKLSIFIHKFSSQYSNSSIYSYRGYSKSKRWQGMPFQYGYPYGYYVWENPSWTNYVYSFKIDRSEMIVWSISDPDNKDYYTLINPNSLKPNLDFLK